MSQIPVFNICKANAQLEQDRDYHYVVVVLIDGKTARQSTACIDSQKAHLVKACAKLFVSKMLQADFLTMSRSVFEVLVSSRILLKMLSSPINGL